MQGFKFLYPFAFLNLSI